MTAILGISAYYHDAAAALVIDGELIAAAQEEAFTRVKHDSRFPQHAIEYCLAEAGLSAAELDYVGFYEKPLVKFERLLETYLATSPRGFRSFLMAMPIWLRKKLHLNREMRQALDGAYKKRFIFPEHHESHAASAFYLSPFEEAAILTLDGVGEWATTTMGTGRGNQVRLTHSIDFPHSLGLLYSAFTYFTGFRVNSGEYKLMGLAPYGEPVYCEPILKELIDVKADGSFRLNMKYFNYHHGLTMTSKAFDQLFGGPPRKPESPLTQREMDLAASVQKVTEDIMLRLACTAHRQTRMKNLCLAGGVALNCVANGRILREGPFENVWIQPAAGDAGGALGTALLIWHQLLNKPRTPGKPDSQKGSLLGPGYQDDEIRACLDEAGATYHECADDDELIEEAAQLLASQRVVGWFQGRMEFGPRALGCRSILGDPRNREMQTTMNLKIKFRESFRPFAPSVLAERASDYFGLEPGQQSPYMLLVAPVVESERQPLSAEEQELRGLEKLKSLRSTIPAVTHVDYSARVQTVGEGAHPRYRRLLQKFEEKTGCGLVINTSFNVRGEPIVRSPREAYRCFMATRMDALVMGRFVLFKDRQAGLEHQEKEEYLASVGVD